MISRNWRWRKLYRDDLLLETGDLRSDQPDYALVKTSNSLPSRRRRTQITQKKGQTQKQIVPIADLGNWEGLRQCVLRNEIQNRMSQTVRPNGRISYYGDQQHQIGATRINSSKIERLVLELQVTKKTSSDDIRVRFRYPQHREMFNEGGTQILLGLNELGLRRWWWMRRKKREEEKVRRVGGERWDEDWGDQIASPLFRNVIYIFVSFSTHSLSPALVHQLWIDRSRSNFNLTVEMSHAELYEGIV